MTGANVGAYALAPEFQPTFGTTPGSQVATLLAAGDRAKATTRTRKTVRKIRVNLVMIQLLLMDHGVLLCIMLHSVPLHNM
jgi:hypothetical protein